MNFLDKLTKKHVFIALFIFIAIVLLFTIKYISDNMLLQPHGTLNVISAPFDITIKYQNKTKNVHAENIDIPVFLTGEINMKNINNIIQYGTKRIALTNAIMYANVPENTARKILNYLP